MKLLYGEDSKGGEHEIVYLPSSLAHWAGGLISSVMASTLSTFLLYPLFANAEESNIPHDTGSNNFELLLSNNTSEHEWQCLITIFIICAIADRRSLCRPSTSKILHWVNPQT